MLQLPLVSPIRDFEDVFFGIFPCKLMNTLKKTQKCPYKANKQGAWSEADIKHKLESVYRK